MRSIRARRARALVVAVAAVAAGLAYLDAQISQAGQSAASNSHASAVEGVEAEIVGTGIVGRLEAALGDAYGGVWFEPSTAQLHVAVTSAAGRRDAEAVAREVGMAQSVVTTAVRSNLPQLEAAQRQWNHRLADLFASGEVKTAVAPDQNSVQIELSASVPASRRTELEREAAADSVAISISVAPDSLFEVVPSVERCSAFVSKSAKCNPTIVSGVTIKSEEINKQKGECTAGPVVIRTAKDRAKPAQATESFLLTAGHCFKFWGGNGKKWYAINKAGEEKEIGKSLEYLIPPAPPGVGYDVGVIKIESNYWAEAKDPPLDAMRAAWSAEKETNPVAVTKAEDPTKGMKSCISGQRSGVQCGTVKNANTSVPVEYTAKENRTAENVAEVEVESGTVGRGDSGGPWFDQAATGVIQGTQVSYTPEKPGAEVGKVSYFQLQSFIFSKLGTKFELLTNTNERRHGKAKAGKYPATIHGSTSGTEKFTTEAGTTECEKGTYHAVLSEASSTLTVTPEYKECTTIGVSTTIEMEGCTYVFHITSKTSTDNYTGSTDISCPEGKSIKVVSGTCKAEIKSQNELSSLDFIDDTTASPKKDVTVRPTLTNFAYTVTQDGFLCPYNGTGEKTGGEYTNTENVTITGQSTTEAAEKIDIEIADE